MATIGEIIKKYRQEHDLSMEEFGRRSGLSKAYISLIERGKNTRSDKPIVPSIDTIKSIADALEMDLDMLLRSIDPDQEIRLNIHHRSGVKIPVLGYVIAGVPIDAVEDILGYEEISAELARTGKFFCLRVKGDSMEPTFVANDIIVVRQQPNVESNEIAVVLVNGDEGTVKRIKKSDNGITLIGDNVSSFLPIFYSKEDIERLPVTIVGKVIELRRPL